MTAALAAVEVPAPTAIAVLDTSQQALAMIPQSLESAWQLAEWLSKSGLFAKRKEPLSTADIFATVLAGIEIGLPPMAALRGLYVVNGKTAMESKTKSAVCLQRGAALYFRRTEHTPTKTTWVTKRRGAVEEVSQSYTRDEAKAAGLLDKDGPWKGYTQRMISHRALGWLCDDVYPDVLMGIPTAEDDERPDAPIFESLGMVGPGVELGAAPAPPKALAPVSSAPAAARLVESEVVPATKPEVPKDTPPPAPPPHVSKPAAGSTHRIPATPQIIEELRAALRASKSEAELKNVAVRISTYELDKTTRDELVIIHYDQQTLLRDAAKAERDAAQHAGAPS